MQRIALALAVAGLVAVAAPQMGLSQNNQVSGKAAVLDVTKVFRNYSKRKDIEKRLRSRTQALDTRFQNEATRVEELSEELNTMNEGSPEFLAKQREIDILRLTIKRDREYERARLGAEARREEAGLYREIVLEARGVAEARGFGIVLMQTELGPDFERASDMDLVMATRTVLWADSRLDLTQEVVNRLNNQ